MIMNQDLLLKI